MRSRIASLALNPRHDVGAMQPNPGVEPVDWQLPGTYRTAKAAHRQAGKRFQDLLDGQESP